MKLFKRPCTRCHKLFQPVGKFQKLCQDCNKSSGSKEKLKNKYFKSKEQLNIIRSNETLSKWKVLSNAYRLGKTIWGRSFTRQRLAHDMDMPYSTVHRCLSLDRANINTWKLIRADKISAFKAAMICQTKSRTFQDEVVNLVIKENYSTYQIKQLRINDLKDVDKERLRLGMEPKFSRKIHAARSFETWIAKGNLLFLTRKSALSDEKYNKIKEELIALKKKIEIYVE